MAIAHEIHDRQRDAYWQKGALYPVMSVDGTRDLDGNLTVGGLVPVINTGGAFATPIVLTAAQSGSVILLNDAAGLDFTLPALTSDNVGIRYTFLVTVANSSNSYRLTAQSGDLLDGMVIMYDKDIAEGSTEALQQIFIPDKSDDLIMTVAGATTAGGLRGGEFTFISTSATSWWVSGYLIGDGSLATIFS